MQFADAAERKIITHQTFGVAAQVGMTRRRQLLDALRDADCFALRGIVHTQVVADLADHHIAGVHTDPNSEADAVFAQQHVAKGAHALANCECRIAGALGVIFVG